MAKLATLSTDIAKSNPDIIAISETWLHSNIADSEISINTYIIFRKDRTICKGVGSAYMLRTPYYTISKLLS
jgi:hypothetical protein